MACFRNNYEVNLNKKINCKRIKLGKRPNGNNLQTGFGHFN